MGKLLMHLANKEPGQCIVDAEYNGEPLDIPSSWISTPPEAGVLCFTYKEPELADDDLRKSVAEDALGWSFE